MAEQHFLDGGDAMAAAILAHDWIATPLGPIDAWPASLKTAVGMLVASRFPKCIVWGPELITIYNEAFRPILGEKPEALGRSFRDVWAEAWDEIGPICAKAFAGEATFIEDFPLIINRHGYAEQAWFTFCYSPIRDEHGRILGMIDTVIETTEKVQTAKNARLLNAELAHRIKNTLAVIMAIVNQSFRSAASLEAAQETLASRINALGNAHTILTQSSWAGAPIKAVIDGALAPHLNAKSRVSLDGPLLHLSAKQSLMLALAINELATNAAKYGALSVSSGEVLLQWRSGAPGPEEPFRFEWRERGGPMVAKPQRSGFGSRLIERALADAFLGEATIDFDPDGVHVVLTTAMINLTVEDGPDA